MKLCNPWNSIRRTTYGGESLKSNVTCTVCLSASKADMDSTARKETALSFGFCGWTRASQERRRFSMTCEEYGRPSSALKIAAGLPASPSAAWRKAGLAAMDSKRKRFHAWTGIETESPLYVTPCGHGNQSSDDTMNRSNSWLPIP